MLSLGRTSQNRRTANAERGQRAQKRKGGGKARRWGKKKKKLGRREASCALVGRAGLNGTRAVGVFVYEGEIGQGRKVVTQSRLRRKGRG